MNLGNRAGITRQIQLDSHNYLGWGGWVVAVTQLEI